MSRRTERLSSLLQQELATFIQRDLADPRITGFPSVTRVKVSEDLSVADVYLTIMGTPGQQSAALNAIRGSGGLMRTMLTKSLSIRQVPFLKFHIDEQLKKELEVMNLLAKVDQEKAEMEERARKQAAVEAEEAARQAAKEAARAAREAERDPQSADAADAEEAGQEYAGGDHAGANRAGPDSPASRVREVTDRPENDGGEARADERRMQQEALSAQRQEAEANRQRNASKTDPEEDSGEKKQTP